MKFRKKPVVVEAVRWFKMGDHPDVSYQCWINTVCKNCDNSFIPHGWIATREGGHIVCPGDWIITGVNGEHYPCKPDIFEKTYEEVKDERP